MFFLEKKWLKIICLCGVQYGYSSNYNWNVIPSGVGFWNSGYYWNNGGGGSYPDSSSAAAYFTDNYTGPVTAQVLEGSCAVGSITINPTFSSGIYQVEIASPGTLVIGSSSGTPGIFLTGSCSGSAQLLSNYTITTPIDLSVSDISISEFTNFNDAITGNISGAHGLYLVTNNNASYHLYLGNASTVNTYAGGTVLASGYMSLGSNSALSPNSYLLVDGTLLTSGYSNTVTYLTGTGTIQMSHGEILTVTNGNSQIFSGSIIGTGGLSLTGGLLSLGTSSYTGPTSVQVGATLQATTSSSFSPNSVFTVDGTLALNGYSETISSLTGSGQVNLLSGETLAINNGADYTYWGTMSGTGNLSLYGGFLTLLPEVSGNDYTGTTDVYSGATLKAGAPSAFSPNSSFNVDGTLDLGGYGQTILSLTGSGEVSLLSGEYLAIANGSGNTYSGAITGIGDLWLETGSFTLAPGSLANSYTGSSSIYVGATLNAGNSSSLSSHSSFQVDGTLNLNNYSNSLSTLSGSGSIALGSATLTLEGDIASSFSGTISGTGSLVVNAGVFSLTTPQSYTGATNVAAFGKLELASLGSIDSSSNFVLNGNFDCSAVSASSVTINQLSGTNDATILNIGEKNLTIVAGGQDFSGTVQGTSGSLTITNGAFNLFPPIVPSDYRGITEVASGALLSTGGNDLLAPSSLYQIDGTLDLNDFSSQIAGLSGSGLVSLGRGTLTLDGDVTTSFSGTISGTGGSLFLNQGEISLTAPQSYTGSTTIQKGAILHLETLGSIDLSESVAIDGSLNVVDVASLQLHQLSGSGQVLLGNTTSLELPSGGYFSGAISGGSFVEFSGGDLFLRGTIQSNQYQELSSTSLKLGYSSFENPPIRVEASDKIYLAGSLIVEDEESPPLTAPKTIVLMQGANGREGTFSQASFQGFSDLIPILSYTSNAVEMTLVPTLSPTVATSFGAISFGFINGRSYLVQRNQHFLHQKMMPSLPKPLPPYEEKNSPEEEAEQFNSTTLFVEREDSIVLDANLETLFVQEEHERIELTERIIEKKGTPWRFYAGPIESLETIDSISSFLGKSVSAQSTGFFSGFDYAFSDFGIGSSFSYVSTWGDGPRQSSNFQFDQSQFALYSTYLPMEDKALAINAIGGFGYNQYHMQRVAGLDFSKIAKSNFGAYHYNLLLGGEYSFSSQNFSQMPECFLITPMLNFQYSQIFTQSYQESGAGLFDLQVGSIDPNSLTSLLAIRFDLPFSGQNWQFKTEIDLGWQYQMLSQKENLSLTVVNLPTPQHLSVPLEGGERNSLWVGLDLFLTAWDHFQVEGSYDLQYNKNFVSQNFYLGFGGTF